MKNAIIILNYNDWENTKLLVQDIKKYKTLDYIIIVDNKSTDDSILELKKLETDKIILVEAKEINGYAAGNNIGIQYAIEKLNVENIIISNPDIIVREKDLGILLHDLENENISVIAPVIKEPLGISRGWKLPTFLSELISNIPFVRRFEFSILSYPKENYKEDLTQVDVVKGCFFIIKKEVLDAIGYFDEHTFLYYEEIIMAKKLKDLGYKTYVNNRVTVLHALDQCISKNVKRIEKFKLIKDSQLYYEKEIVKRNVFAILILRIFYYFYLFGLQIEGMFRKK